MSPALEPYMNWWRNLPPRERWIATLGAAVLAFALAYFALWAPIKRDLVKLQKAVPENRSKLALMRAQAQQVANMRGQAPRTSASGNLLSTLEQSANAKGLRQAITRMEPEGNDGARLHFDEVSFNSLASWLAELQTQGVRVDTATVQRRPQPGMVSARVAVRAR